jgi:hypothetical protein
MFAKNILINEDYNIRYAVKLSVVKATVHRKFLGETLFIMYLHWGIEILINNINRNHTIPNHHHSGKIKPSKLRQ